MAKLTDLSIALDKRSNGDALTDNEVKILVAYWTTAEEILSQNLKTFGKASWLYALEQRDQMKDVATRRSERQKGVPQEKSPVTYTAEDLQMIADQWGQKNRAPHMALPEVVKSAAAWAFLNDVDQSCAQALQVKQALMDLSEKGRFFFSGF